MSEITLPDKAVFLIKALLCSAQPMLWLPTPDRESRLPSRPATQRTNLGDLAPGCVEPSARIAVAAPQSGDPASGQWGGRGQRGLGGAGRRSAVHPAMPASFSRLYPPLLPNSGWRKRSRKE